MYIPMESRTIGPNNVKSLKVAQDQVESFCAVALDQLKTMGIVFDQSDINQMHHYLVAQKTMNATGMDNDLIQPLSNQSVPTPIQFLQHWLPGFVEVITDARKIDNLIGITNQGRFEDEEIVQGYLEHTGTAQEYGDYTAIPLANWNVEYPRRTIVRFEEGITVGKLEEMRAASVRVNSAESKRKAAVRALEINRNSIGFNGYDNGSNRTYGFLNDPNLPAYVTVATGASGGTTWATKTFTEIVSDLLTAFAQLRTQSGDIINPKQDALTLAISTTAVDFLSTTSDFNVTAHDWLKDNYPNVRIESAPELEDADGNADVFYIYADSVSESGSDDLQTFIQVVPNKFQSMGVDQRGKNYTESYANATAGVFLKRPYAVVRYSGI